ncbi:hypothetical protein [Pseudomonas sp. GTC 16482]|uniref:hypothetical protein n=1 Tax=Pseudomonas sp. GTC 16482 TaxID=1661693 RepID=UPI0007616FF6|nr:hypothetical protein [Pseudomonas sp. GTC 16482]
MQFKCYGNRTRIIIDAAAFAAFRAEDKYVIGVLPDGAELMLPDGVTLKAIEQALPTVLRANRGTLIARQHITGLVGSGQHRNVCTVVGEYQLARRQRPEPFAQACEENARRQRELAGSATRSAYGCH